MTGDGRMPVHATRARIRTAIAERRCEAALQDIDSILRVIGDWPELLVLKARAIQLSDHEGPTLEGAEACLLAAFCLDPQHTEAIQDLAHFYAIVVRKPEEANRFAKLYADLTSEALRAIREAIDDESVPSLGDFLTAASGQDPDPK